MDPNRLPFADFLRDVLRENSAESSRTAPIQGLTLLDFCDHGNLELSDGDFTLLDHLNTEGNHELAYGARPPPETHGRENSTEMAQVRQDLVEMWTNAPRNADHSRTQSGGRKGQRTLDTTGSSDSAPQSRYRIDRVIFEKLDQSARDRVLAMVLSYPRQTLAFGRVASSFPSVEVMDILVHSFLSSLANQASEWVHFPTFRLNAQSPEWIAVAAAAGAVLSPVPSLRAFGFMLQEAARKSLVEAFITSTCANVMSGATLPSQVCKEPSFRHKPYCLLT